MRYFVPAFAFAVVHAICAQTLPEKVEALAATSPVGSRGAWGAQFLNLATGEVIYSHHENHYFVPASNAKLFSTALALTQLGPGHRQLTQLMTASAPDAAGTVHGDLRLVGGGDATLTGRAIPYDAKAARTEPLAALDDLAEQAWQSGLRRVEGDIVGDDSAYVWEPFPAGWSQGDTLFGYGAPVSALMLHDNTFTVRVDAGQQPGETPSVTISPSPSYWTIESRVRTGIPVTGVHMEREPGSRQIELWGMIAPRRTALLSLAVDDPAVYAAFAMRDALERRGIVITGSVAANHRHPLMGPPAPTVQNGERPEAVELARRLSPPLIETLRVINKVSQNLQAEAVMMEVARAKGRTPDRAGATAELRAFLETAGIPSDDFHFEDASGLSRLTLITPATVIRLLRYMAASPFDSAFRGVLPQGGLDGTLEVRFRKFKGAVIRAKTGSLSHTSALSGYIERPGSAPIAFSIMVNNANSGARAIREFIDRLVLTVLE